ncbi:hypothetical protein [Notoacmeibacter marinus]|uniref:hypothetical protein n=1 Tax=Notoacmeibacter marinus TaxID=1876515 RepID=UPI0013B05849|nr:hypothetical protein [Notoacmeibacter marinus]
MTAEERCGWSRDKGKPNVSFHETLGCNVRMRKSFRCHLPSRFASDALFDNYSSSHPGKLVAEKPPALQIPM